MTKSRIESLELEKQEMMSTICALNTELAEANNMLADNQPLVSLGDQLSKLKSINRVISLLAADRFYAMAQAVMPELHHFFLAFIYRRFSPTYYPQKILLFESHTRTLFHDILEKNPLFLVEKKRKFYWSQT